jgi:hypothetical protein
MVRPRIEWQPELCEGHQLTNEWQLVHRISASLSARGLEAGKSRLASRRTGSCGIASAVKHGCGDDRLELAQGMFDPADN